jgi:hypothetical protein
MKLRRSSKIAVVITVSFIAIVSAGSVYISQANRQSAINTTILWARLSPFPPQVRNLRVAGKGSMFTREFVISFDAPPKVIQQWIASSPGPSSATLTATGSVTMYAITPGGGASFAEVKVDNSSGHVVIRSYWS